MKIWLATMECAGIAEAGGVKDVSYSLAKGFDKAGSKVTLFIPVFGCTVFNNIEKLEKKSDCFEFIEIFGHDEKVSYFTGILKNTNVKVVFVNHKSFLEKQAVYVYTAEEQKINPRHVRGCGHEDYVFLDALFSKAVCAYVKQISENDIPDVIHCQDASTAVIPCYAEQLNTYFKNTKYVVTIHNAGPAYHHEFMDFQTASYFTGLPDSVISEAMNGNRVEPYLLASKYAQLTTVSSFYAEELVNPENEENTDGLSSRFNEKRITITGITNGIDYDLYSPEKKSISKLPYSYNPLKGKFSGKKRCRNFFLKMSRKKVLYRRCYKKYLQNISRFGYIDNNLFGEEPVYFMYHGRIVWQKGISVLLDSLDEIFINFPFARFFIVGQGDPVIEENIKLAVKKFEGKIVFFNGYNEPISRLVAAASDFAVLPSYFEPCCLEDFIAQIYGTLPISHSTGGLKKILDGKTGFLYEKNEKQQLVQSIKRAYECFKDRDAFNDMLISTVNYIKNVYSWDNVINQNYLKFFKNL